MSGKTRPATSHWQKKQHKSGKTTDLPKVTDKKQHKSGKTTDLPKVTDKKQHNLKKPQTCQKSLTNNNINLEKPQTCQKSLTKNNLNLEKPQTCHKSLTKKLHKFISSTFSYGQKSNSQLQVVIGTVWTKKYGAVMVVIVCLSDSKLPIQSVPIITNVVSLNPTEVRCTQYNIM
jgi:hypothetical protein